MPAVTATGSTHPWITVARPAGRPLVFAHRGGSALAPENTMAAFEQAASLGVDGFEFDVGLTRDDEVVVFHDEHLDRTTNATGPLSARTASELAAIDAGYHFDPEHGFPARGRGIGVPRLRDVLLRFPELPCVIELKGRNGRLARRAVEVAREAGALHRICFGGFSGVTLSAARAAGGAEVCTSAVREETRWALYRSWVGLSIGNGRYQAFQIPEMSGRTRVVSPRFLRAAHAAGLLVQVWTVDEEADMRRLIGWGVDGLITDRPDIATRVVRSSRP
jgi:glycerophosphoryl diester phosphodiesterase